MGGTEMNMTMRLSVVASAALMSLGMSGSVQAQQQAPNTTFFVTSAWPPNLNLTCNNWSSSTFGSAMLGHIDRTPQMPENLRSWNAAHMSRSCSQPDLIATGGNGLFYCFAQ